MTHDAEFGYEALAALLCDRKCFVEVFGTVLLMTQRHAPSCQLPTAAAERITWPSAGLLIESVKSLTCSRRVLGRISYLTPRFRASFCTGPSGDAGERPEPASVHLPSLPGVWLDPQRDQPAPCFPCPCKSASKSSLKPDAHCCPCRARV